MSYLGYKIRDIAKSVLPARWNKAVHNIEKKMRKYFKSDEPFFYILIFPIVILNVPCALMAGYVGSRGQAGGL